jgi:glycosyltransferase A (GT-A) superfamily protein (DUF2064 family)
VTAHTVPVMSPSSLIAIFSKAPACGSVKTRLAADIGADRTLELARAMLSQTIANASETGLDLRLHLAGPTSGLDELTPVGISRISVVQQRQPTIAAEVANGVRFGLEHGYERVVVLPGDAPTVDSTLQLEVVQLLDRHDVVLSPSPDGGFACLGVREPLPSLFARLDLSAINACERIVDMYKCRARNVGFVSSRIDIDDAQSLHAALVAGQIDTASPLGLLCSRIDQQATVE